MGIIPKSASICTIAIAPSGNLYTGIPFIEFLLLWRCTCVDGILCPMAYTELRTGTQELILHEQHIQEAGSILVKCLTGKALVVSNRPLILLASLISQSLTGDIHQVVFEVIITTILLCHAIHQTGSLLGVGRIVIVFHLRPRRCLEVIQRGTTTEDTLVRTLLVVACRTVIDALSQYHPSLLDGCILHAITGFDIVLQPCLLGKLLWAPRQFTHQLEHHRIVLRALHRKADTLTVGLRYVEVVEQLVHAAVETYVGAKVLKQAEEPLMLLIALFALPDAGNAKHRTALREEVEHQQITRLHTIHHLWTGVLCPTLNHPNGLGIDAFHGLHHCLTSLGIVDIRVVVALVEGVHRVIIGLSKEFCQLIII